MLLVAVLGWVLWSIGAPWWVWVLFGIGALDVAAGVFK